MNLELSLSSTDTLQSVEVQQKMSTILYINAMNSLMYFSTCTWSHTSYTFHKLVRFNISPDIAH